LGSIDAGNDIAPFEHINRQLEDVLVIVWPRTFQRIGFASLPKRIAAHGTVPNITFASLRASSLLLQVLP
jgi:hypothetical protein